MLASELKKLSDSYNAAPKEVSVEVMTVLRNVANTGRYSVSFRELSANDCESLKEAGFTVWYSSDWIDNDSPYSVRWDK